MNIIHSQLFVSCVKGMYMCVSHLGFKLIFIAQYPEGRQYERKSVGTYIHLGGPRHVLQLNLPQPGFRHVVDYTIGSCPDYWHLHKWLFDRVCIISEQIRSWCIPCQSSWFTVFFFRTVWFTCVVQRKMLLMITQTKGRWKGEWQSH